MGRKSNTNRVGEIYYNNCGSKMKIIKYKSVTNIDILFVNSNYIRKKVSFKHVKSGSVKCPFDKTVYGIGYIGDGIFSRRDNLKCYKRWQSMIQRCYDNKEIDRNPCYKDVYVCEHWHNFQNFAKWYEENYYKIKGEIMHLDKDILVRNSGIYSPDTCVFVPNKINQIFIRHKDKNKKLPYGVTISKNGQYEAKVWINSKQENLGFYNTINDAFMKYKTSKEDEICRLANKFKNYIPTKLYNALLKWDVRSEDV